VSRRLVNDSINQTLSRTLLTGGTTILTIFVMYLMGGAGIHGFTFALLVGILVGTYSSIAIASPILLLGGKALAADESVSSSRARAAGQLQRA
jgi:preprotein translocase subunit SecF